MSPRALRRARTAAGLPGRVVAVEDRCSAIEAHVSTKIDEMRADLAELRRLVTAQLEADADSAELLGQLLRANERRLDELEERLAPAVPGGAAVALPDTSATP